MSNRRLRGTLEEKFRLDLAAGKKVVAGVSGGADSMAMLHFLWKNGVSVTAAHLNHCLRGAESDGDEELVRRFCRERRKRAAGKNATPFSRSWRGRTG